MSEQSRKEFEAWVAAKYPGAKSERPMNVIVLGDSIIGSEETVDGHIKHVTTLRHFSASGQYSLLEHTVVWEMSDDYWLSHATPAVLLVKEE